MAPAHPCGIRVGCRWPARLPPLLGLAQRASACVLPPVRPWRAQDATTDRCALAARGGGGAWLVHPRLPSPRADLHLWSVFHCWSPLGYGVTIGGGPAARARRFFDAANFRCALCNRRDPHLRARHSGTVHPIPWQWCCDCPSQWPGLGYCEHAHGRCVGRESSASEKVPIGFSRKQSVDI